MNNNRKTNDEVCALTKSLKAAYKKITELRAENEELRKENAQNAIYRDENTKTFIQMSKEYKIVCSQLEEIKKENHELKKLLAKSIEKEQLKTKEIFGRSSEKIDITNPDLSEKCRDAIKYSLNQKEKLMNFLLDGNLPLDNNSCERSVKSVALLRRASLFSYSVEGAQANTIMYSIVETVRANNANPYWYIRYILEVMPTRLNGTDRNFLKSMTPWSQEYKEYERKHSFVLDAPYEHAGLDEKPKTPRKKDRQIIA